MDPNKLPLETCHLLIPSSASKSISELMVPLAEIVHLSCTDTNNVSKRGVPSGASKTMYEPMVCLTQTVHLSCVKISTPNGQKWVFAWPRHLGVPSGASKTISEPMIRLAQTMHNIAPTLTHDPRHLGVPSGVSKMIFWAYDTFDANHAPILCQD
jgi:hypothetical protein